MKKRCLFVFTLALFGCAENEDSVFVPDTSEEEVMDTLEVDWETFKSCSIEEDQMIRLDAVIHELPRNLKGDEKSVSVKLVERRNQETSFWTSAFVGVGNALQEIYLNGGTALITSKGDTLREGDYVNVMGTYSLPDDKETCHQAFIHVAVIAKRDVEIASEVLAQAMPLTANDVADTLLQNTYVSLETAIEIPNSLYREGPGSWLELNNDFTTPEFSISAYFLHGTEAGKLNANVGAVYSDRALKVQDVNGTEQAIFQQKFRLYGTYSCTSEHGSLKVEEVVRL